MLNEELYDTMHDEVISVFCRKCGARCTRSSKGIDENCPECNAPVIWEEEEYSDRYLWEEDYTEPAR